MEFSVDSLHKVKIGLHIAQAVLIFAAWCIAIALLTSDNTTIGRADGWYFALCFLSIPVLIYQTLTLHFIRSRKWANAYAFAILDIIWCILWLSAFASVAAWNSAGECGSSKPCSLSKAMVGMGFFIFLFFALTFAISLHGAIYFHREGVLPGSSRMPLKSSTIDPDREAFSTLPSDEYAALGVNDKDDHDSDQEHGHGLSTQGSRYDMNLAYSGSVGNRYGSNSPGAGAGAGAGASYLSPDDVGASSYRPAYVADEATSYSSEPMGEYGAPPPVQPGERLQFPAGNYH